MVLPPAEIPLVVGLVLAWSLAAPPGPANAVIAQDAARHGFARGWWSGVGAVAGDLTMFLLMWFGLLRVLGAYPWLHVALGASGAALMVLFAHGAWRAARRPDVPEAPGSGAWRNYLIVVTSPFNWGWWLTAGSALFARLGLATVLGFFAGLLLWIAFWSGLARASARRVRGFVHWVGYASAVVLVVFAALAAWIALSEAWRLWAA